MKKTDTFVSSDGQSKLNYYAYIPEGEVKAILQISHGMNEYVERYEGLATFLSAKGILFCGNDHLGHGDSDQRGYFAEREGYRYLVEDLRKTQQIIKKTYPQTPYILLGHSMGSFVARLFLAKYGDSLQGCIIMGSADKKAFSGAGLLLAKLLAKSKGARYRSKFLHELIFLGYNKEIEQAKTDVDWLSRDEAVVEAYLNDSKIRFTFTASAFADLIELQRRANRKSCIEAIPDSLPLYLMSGDADPLGDYGKGIAKLYRKLESAGKNVRMKLYAGGRHEIINEINRQEVHEDIADFILEIAGNVFD